MCVCVCVFDDECVFHMCMFGTMCQQCLCVPITEPGWWFDWLITECINM